MKDRSTSKSKTTKSPANRTKKVTSAPPLSGRYSRSEGAGPGPKRARPRDK